MDTTALESGYKRLLDVARGGAFAPPADTVGWTAEQVLAHVIAGDRLLAQSTAELLAGGSPRYTNEPANRRVLLDEIARAYGDVERLVTEARSGGLVLVRLVRQLDDATGATAVPTCLVDGDVTRMNTPMPWSGVLNTHAEVHLPARADQLEALRGA